MQSALIAEAVLIVVLVSVIIYQLKYFHRRTSELLDRLMARDLPEYQRLQVRREKKHSPIIHNCMTDADMAEYEKSRKALSLNSGGNTSPLEREEGSEI